MGPFKVQTHIGWFEDVRKQPQELLICLEFGLSIQAAAATDELAETVDYDLVLKIKKCVEESTCKLLETLTQQIAQICLRETKALHVKVRVEKRLPFDTTIPGAVEIIRFRSEQTN